MHNLVIATSILCFESINAIELCSGRGMQHPVHMVFVSAVRQSHAMYMLARIPR